MKLSRLVIFSSSLILGACGSATDEGGSVTTEISMAENDAVEAPVEEATFAEVNGTRLFYDVQGAGPWLVLISGANLDRRLWDDQVGDFAERFRVLRYDPRGIGRSDLPEGPFSHYEDLRALLQFLGIERTSVLGFSFGGGVALDFTAQYPEMVDSLVLIAPGLSSWKGDLAPVLAELSELAVAEGRPKAVEMLLADPSMPGQDLGEARDKMKAILDDSDRLFASGFAYLRMMEPLAPPVEERLDAIAVPTLLVVGERDHPGIHQNVDTLQEGIEGARKVLIMGVGHMISLEKPEEFRRIVFDFLGTE
jgi:pimeloyl-ACP methyl ester carboxylesterase